jgi:methylmalonyl-CoA carboxyltransferase large subunit
VAVDLTLLMTAGLLAVVCGVTYLRLKRAFRQAAAELQRSGELQINALAATVKELERRVAGLSSELSQAVKTEPVSVPVSAPVVPVAAATPVVRSSPVREEEEITPELLVVMAAAVTAFLGKKVRIRSAKMLQSPYEIVNPWSQQGRVFVQASHNLRSRG